MTPVNPKYLFLAVRGGGDHFLLQHLYNNTMDFKIVRRFEQSTFIFQTKVVTVFTIILLAWVFPFGTILLTPDNVGDCFGSKSNQLRFILQKPLLPSIYEALFSFLCNYVCHAIQMPFVKSLGISQYSETCL